MRHLINTYIQADPAADLGNLSSLSLTELIIETGIHDAIARKLNQKGKLSKNAIAGRKAVISCPQRARATGNR
jgi:type I restriction enzyme R subunit